MAYLSGKDCAYVFIDSVDVAVSNNEVDISTEAICPLRRPLGQAYKSAFLTGQVDSELAIRGWLDSVTTTQLGDATGDAKVASVLFGGNTISQLFAGFKTVYVQGRKLGISEDDLDTYEPVLVTSSCKADIGYVVAPFASRGAASDTDSTNAVMTETSGATGTAFLHVTALDLGGYTSLTVTVRDSSDDSSYGDHTAFAAMTAVGAQTIALPTQVDKYLSIKWAYAGAGSNPSWSGFVGVAI